MNKRKLLKQIMLGLSMSACSFCAFALDVIKLQTHQMSQNKAAHSAAVLQRALEITEPEYGAFKLEEVNITMNSARLLQSLITGELINVAYGPERNLWQEKIISVKVPVRLGLLSYRLLLVNKNALDEFKDVDSLDELKKIPVGLHSGWMTTKVLKANQFNTFEAGHFESLFLMLNKHRFDYIPRGIYEIFDELSARQDTLTNLTIEPTIALYIPTLTYVNVSPTQPRLAKRLEAGLITMLNSGELKTLLYQYYGKDIKQANLESRNIIKINNAGFNPPKELEQHMLLSDFPK